MRTLAGPRPAHSPAAVELSEEHVDTSPADPGVPAGRSVGVQADPAQLLQLRSQVGLARAVVALQDDPALLEARSERERAADRAVTEKIRAGRRAERLRAGKEELRRLRQARGDTRWSERATRARERLVNPDRRLATTYRRFVLLQAADLSLIVAGVVWMSVTVHDGLVGVDGPWVAYLVEPMASVLLVVSMLAQLTAVEHGRRVSRWFIALDIGLVAASLLLNVVPWGLRYGFSAGDLVAHVLPPLLVAAAVIVYHMLNELFGGIFTDAHEELADPQRLSEQTADVMFLVERTRRAVSAGQITLGDDGIPVAAQIARRFDIATQRAQLTADAFRIIAAARAEPRPEG